MNRSPAPNRKWLKLHDVLWLGKDGQNNMKLLAMQASLKLTCFRHVVYVKLGANLELVEDFKSHTHTRVKFAPTHCSPRNTGQGHLTSCCPNVLLTWAALGGWARKPGSKTLKHVENKPLEVPPISSVSHCSISWAEHVASLFETVRQYVSTQPIIISIQLHAHNTHTHTIMSTRRSSSPLWRCVPYLWQSFVWNKTGQNISNHLHSHEHVEILAVSQSAMSASQPSEGLGWLEGLTWLNMA